MDSLPARLAHATPISVKGTWQRHVPAKHLANALAGRRDRGRERPAPLMVVGADGHFDPAAVRAARKAEMSAPVAASGSRFRLARNPV